MGTTTYQAKRASITYMTTLKAVSLEGFVIARICLSRRLYAIPPPAAAPRPTTVSRSVKKKLAPRIQTSAMMPTTPPITTPRTIASIEVRWTSSTSRPVDTAYARVWSFGSESRLATIHSTILFIGPPSLVGSEEFFSGRREYPLGCRRASDTESISLGPPTGCVGVGQRPRASLTYRSTDKVCSWISSSRLPGVLIMSRISSRRSKVSPKVERVEAAPGRAIAAAGLAGRIREVVKIAPAVEVVPSGTIPDEARPLVDARDLRD